MSRFALEHRSRIKEVGLSLSNSILYEVSENCDSQNILCLLSCLAFLKILKSDNRIALLPVLHRYIGYKVAIL